MVVTNRFRKEEIRALPTVVLDHESVVSNGIDPSVKALLNAMVDHFNIVFLRDASNHAEALRLSFPAALAKWVKDAAKAYAGAGKKEPPAPAIPSEAEHYGRVVDLSVSEWRGLLQSTGHRLFYYIAPSELVRFHLADDPRLMSPLITNLAEMCRRLDVEPPKEDVTFSTARKRPESSRKETSYKFIQKFFDK